jgi:hypothetical protein
MKQRVFYGITALCILAIEVCIALFAHGFVRNSLGDVLAVILVHCALRVLFLRKPRALPLYVFLFACAVEFTQYIHLLDSLGLGHIAWLRIAAGGTFSWGDILCYLAGCAIAALLEYLYYAKHFVKG